MKSNEITLPVAELKDALPGISRIIGRMRTLPILMAVRITKDIQGQVRLHATDLDSFVSYALSAEQPGGPVDMVLPFEHLTKAVKGTATTASITLVCEGKDKARIKRPIAGTTMEQTVDTLSPEEWPPVPPIRQPGVQMEPAFGKAFKEALQMCSDDPSRYILRGACLDVNDKKFHYIVGTNGRALYSANSFSFDLKKSVVIPDSKFLTAVDLMEDEPCYLSVEPGTERVEAKDGLPAIEAIPGWVRFQLKQWTFITREIEGQFPNWKQCVPKTSDSWTTIDLSDDAIKEMLQVIPNMPGNEGNNYPITISVDHDLVISGRNSPHDDWTKVSINSVNVHGNPVSICLNRNYLVKALRFGLKHMQIEDELTPIVFTHKGRKLVIMPIRMEGDPTEAKPAEPVPPVASEAPQSQEQPAEQEPTTPSQTEETNERTEMRKSATSGTSEVTKEQDVEFHGTNRINGANGHGGAGSNGTNGTTANQENGSAVKSLVEHVDKIKDALRDVIRSLSEVTDALKQAEKEKRTTEKEVEGIRSKLRQIQSVSI